MSSNTRWHNVESEYPKSIAKITIDEDYVGHTHE